MSEAEVPFICNSCFCILEGFRYKCLSCADFDLCEKVRPHDRYFDHILSIVIA